MKPPWESVGAGVPPHPHAGAMAPWEQVPNAHEGDQQRRTQATVARRRAKQKAARSASAAKPNRRRV
jgi:hypothetical protein